MHCQMICTSPHFDQITRSLAFSTRWEVPSAGHRRPLLQCSFPKDLSDAASQVAHRYSVVTHEPDEKVFFASKWPRHVPLVKGPGEHANLSAVYLRRVDHRYPGVERGDKAARNGLHPA